MTLEQRAEALLKVLNRKRLQSDVGNKKAIVSALAAVVEACAEVASKQSCGDMERCTETQCLVAVDIAEQIRQEVGR